MHCCGALPLASHRTVLVTAPVRNAVVLRRPLSSPGTSACRALQGACRSTRRNADPGFDSEPSPRSAIGSHITGSSDSIDGCSCTGSSSSRSTDDSSSVQQWALGVLATAGNNVPLKSTVLCLGVLTVLLAHGGTAHAAEGLQPSGLHHLTAQPVFGDIAGEEDFWRNVGAYIRFFVTVMLGTANVVTKPFRDAAKSPATTAAVVLGSVALFAFMTFTVKLMLGIGEESSNFEYLTRGI